MNSTTVLICDDNIAVHESLKPYLNEVHIDVISAFDGEEALQILAEKKVSLVILDIMLPKMFGTEVLKKFRKSSEVPVIFLSAKTDELDRILGLELGADDYVTKPFSPREVVTRVQVILKRSFPKTEIRHLTFGNLVVEPEAYNAFCGNEKLSLSSREVAVLALLIENSDKALSRERILNIVWGYEYFGDTRAVDTQIKRLRQKLPENCGCEIRSIYSVGYKIELI